MQTKLISAPKVKKNPLQNLLHKDHDPLPELPFTMFTVKKNQDTGIIKSIVLLSENSKVQIEYERHKVLKNSQKLQVKMAARSDSYSSNLFATYNVDLETKDPNNQLFSSLRLQPGKTIELGIQNGRFLTEDPDQEPLIVIVDDDHDIIPEMDISTISERLTSQKFKLIDCINDGQNITISIKGLADGNTYNCSYKIAIVTQGRAQLAPTAKIEVYDTFGRFDGEYSLDKNIPDNKKLYNAIARINNLFATAQVKKDQLFNFEPE